MMKITQKTLKTRKLVTEDKNKYLIRNQHG